MKGRSAVTATAAQSTRVDCSGALGLSACGPRHGQGGAERFRSHPPFFLISSSRTAPEPLRGHYSVRRLPVRARPIGSAWTGCSILVRARAAFSRRRSNHFALAGAQDGRGIEPLPSFFGFFSGSSLRLLPVENSSTRDRKALEMRAFWTSHRSRRAASPVNRAPRGPPLRFGPTGDCRQRARWSP